MMHDRARSKAHRTAARQNPREQFGILARDGIAADHAEVLAKFSEARERRALESDIGAEIVVQPLGG